MEETPEANILIAKSKFGRRIRLAKATWLDKISIDHPEFGAREEYVNEVKRAVENPDYIVSGWFGELHHGQYNACTAKTLRGNELHVTSRIHQQYSDTTIAYIIQRSTHSHTIKSYPVPAYN